jgi:hypothetical protein
MPKLAISYQSMLANFQRNYYMKDQERRVSCNFAETTENDQRGGCFSSLGSEYSDLSCLLWIHCLGNLELAQLDYFQIYLTA